MDEEYLDDMALEPKDNMALEPEDDMALEPEDDMALESENVDLNGTESDDTNINEDSVLSQPNSQVFVKKQKKIERLSGSPVKLFFETKLINNIEYWFCQHKSCTSRVKYIKDGSISNLWRHMRNRYHISRAMIEVVFKRIIEGLDIQANVLGYDRLKEILINSEDKILQNLREYALDSAKISYISFTTDMWTSSNAKEMIGNISYLPYPYTSECLFNKITEILDNLQLKHITVSSTVDNGSNIKSCLEKLKRKYGIFNIYCFGHTLQLAINDALKECLKITNLIKKCKDIVSHFSGSPKQKQFLLEAQIEIEDWDNFLFVVRDVSTRWNSTFYMLKRLTTLKPAIYKYKSFLVEINDNSLLRSYEEKELSSDEWEKIAELVKLLYPYKIISKKLSGSTYPTLSQAWFAINFIKIKLNCTIINNIDIQKFRSLLGKSIQKQFSEPTKPIRLAAFFDSRTKDMQIFTENEKNNTISEAHMEYLELANNYYRLDSLSDTASDSIMNSEEDIFSDPVAQEHSSQNDDDNIANREFNSYLLLPRVPSDTDILQWWASRKANYPILAKLARKYLSIPATSVPFERFFSSAGLTITEKRTSLNSEFVESILFLKVALKLWPVSHVF
ncbi:756_t:CDS:2, partial [Scutellospora calospora]